MVTLAQGPAAAMTADELAIAMLPAFRTPLGPLADEKRLTDIPRSDRLVELGFEYPLAGGDMTNAEVTLGLVGPLLRRHLDGSHLLAAYPDLLEDPTLASQVLRGYLTGSIDAVLRIWREDQPRYLVVDYKTNWLGALDGETLTIGDYTPARMAEAMMTRALPAPGAAVRGGRTPDAALAATRLRSGGSSRRRSLPLRTWHGRAGNAARGRRAVWRLQLAAAAIAGRRVVSPPRWGLAMITPVRSELMPQRAAGLLAPFSLAGVLNPADVHTAETVCRIGGESDENVRLALALTVRALRNGSVCIDLGTVHATAFDEAESAIDMAELPWPEPDAWSQACARSPLVADGAGHAGWPAAAAGERAALSGAVLATRGAGSRPAAAPFRCAGPRDRPFTAVDSLAQIVRPRRLRRR